MNKKKKLTEEKYLNAFRSRQANYEFDEKVNNLRIYIRFWANRKQMAPRVSKNSNLKILMFNSEKNNLYLWNWAPSYELFVKPW